MSDPIAAKGSRISRLEWFDREIEHMEQRVLNAATVEAARHFHERLDQLRRARRDLSRLIEEGSADL